MLNHLHQVLPQATDAHLHRLLATKR